jgi:CheY-like chemotaxis protein
MVHDFNNLLMGILSSITLARLDGSGSPEVVRTLEEAEKAVRRATGLTHQLLTFSRGGAPVRRALALGDLLRETAEFALVGSNARVQFSIPDGLWPAEADPAQISQVVQNLVINAAEAMPEGGVVAVAAANATLDAASGIPLPPGRYVKLVVRDTGVGIAPENLSRIFDPYFTTKGAGSGLGLAVVHSILRNHGGHIQVQSRLGAGSTFEAYLPAAEARAHPAAPSPEAPRRARRVLVMDDDAIIRHGVERLLRRAGYGVATAADGDEAVRLYSEAARRGERFDAVVLDLTVVGGMGGGACLERLRALDPDVRAIAASGFHRDAVLAEARDRGFCATVAKPFSLEQLISALDDATA